MSKEEEEQANQMSIPYAVEDDSNGDEGGSSSSRNVHQFYLVKFWPFFKDPEYNSKMEWIKKQGEELDQEKQVVVDDKLREIKSRGRQITSKLESERFRCAFLGGGVEWKEMLVDFLQLHINQLKISAGIQVSPTANVNRDWIPMSSLLQELDRAWFWYSNSKNRENFEQLLGEIRQTEERHQKAKANADAAAAANGDTWNPLSSITVIEEQIQLLDKIPGELEPEIRELEAEIKGLEDEVEALKRDEHVVYEKFQVLINRKSELCDIITSIRNQESEVNAKYKQYLSLIDNAKELARKKDVAALEELSHNQVDEFMFRWNNEEALRMTYEKAVLPSLDYRELSRDGRIRNQDDQPIIMHKEDVDKASIFCFSALLAALDVQNQMLRWT